MKNIAVIGAGTMGNGIAHVFAQKGFAIHLVDAQAAALAKAITTITKNIDRQIAKGIVSEDDKQRMLQNIYCFESIKLGVQEADLVIEAATENSGIKKIFLLP